MADSILKTLDELQPETAFLEMQAQLRQVTTTVSQLDVVLPQLDAFREQLRAPDLSYQPVTAMVQTAPPSTNSLKTELATKLEPLRTIQATPPTPRTGTASQQEGATDSQGGEMQPAIATLNHALDNDRDLSYINAQLRVLFPDLAELLTIQAAPEQMVCNRLQVFTVLLQALAPQTLANRLSSGHSTAQVPLSQSIQTLSDQLPNNAVDVIDEQVKQRRGLIRHDYLDLLTQLPQPADLTPTAIADLTAKTTQISEALAANHTTIQTALEHLRTFDIDRYKGQLQTLFPEPAAAISATADEWVPFFGNLKRYLVGCQRNQATITAQLQLLAERCQGLQAQHYRGDSQSETAQNRVATAQQTVQTLPDDLHTMVDPLTTFVTSAAEQIVDFIQAVRQAMNTFSEVAVDAIDTCAQAIQSVLTEIETAIRAINEQIKTHLNREQLERRINQVLDEVTVILENPQLQAAVDGAKDGVDTMVKQLRKVSLEPTFQGVVNQTAQTEAQLKAVAHKKLSPTQRTALKLGTGIVADVDIPGAVAPELKAEFAEILDPLERLIATLAAAVNQIEKKIAHFQPGTLAHQALMPYINDLTQMLATVKPSRLLQPVHTFYHDLLKQLERFNPQHLLVVLESLYQRLVDVVEALSPAGIIQVLEQDVAIATQQLQILPTDPQESSAPGVDGPAAPSTSTVASQSILDLRFWQQVETLLTFNVSQQLAQLETWQQQTSGSSPGTNTIQSSSAASLETVINHLGTSLDEYVNKAKVPRVGISVYDLTMSVRSYRYDLEDLQEKWPVLDTQWSTFKPSKQLAAAYQDLYQNLQTLYRDFTASASPYADPEAILDETEAILKAGDDRIKPYKSKRKQLLQALSYSSYAQLPAELKQSTAEGLDADFFKGLSALLTQFDATLTQPRTALRSVQRVIQQLEQISDQAPAKDATAKRSQSLAAAAAKTDMVPLPEAVGTLKQDIEALDFRFITESYDATLAQIQNLSPRSLLNLFYDASDFKDFAGLCQKIQAASNPIAQFIQDQLPDGALQQLGRPDAKPTQAVVIEALNQVLKNPAFYQVQWFANLSLTPETRDLLKRKSQLDASERLHLNRLLLEAAYAKEIQMNMESIYPYLLHQLAAIYPTKAIAQLDGLHANCIQVVKDGPQALGNALDHQYKVKILGRTQALRDSVTAIFPALQKQLATLEAELNTGLDDVGQAFNRLQHALP